VWKVGCGGDFGGYGEDGGEDGYGVLEVRFFRSWIFFLGLYCNWII
jgi:hypothetical protein